MLWACLGVICSCLHISLGSFCWLRRWVQQELCFCLMRHIAKFLLAIQSFDYIAQLFCWDGRFYLLLLTAGFQDWWCIQRSGPTISYRKDTRFGTSPAPSSTWPAGPISLRIRRSCAPTCPAELRCLSSSCKYQIPTHWSFGSSHLLLPLQIWHHLKAGQKPHHSSFLAVPFLYQKTLAPQFWHLPFSFQALHPLS